MALLNDADLAYLREQATKRGYNADDLLKVINHESSGNPNIWGGKGKNYFGLIQFGPNERAQFGVDTKNPSAQNQIDAAFKYLNARGFKPGMGLLDLYSTVNAGSPGHYNASDRPGMTVASHVARMGGATPQSQPSPPTQEPPPFSTYPTPQPPPSTPTPTTAANALPIFAQMDVSPPEIVGNSESELPTGDNSRQYDREAMRGLLASLFPQDVAQAQEAPQAAPELPQASPMPKRGRGLAFHQLTVKSHKFRTA